MSAAHTQAVVQRFLADVGRSGIGPYAPLSKATAIADGFANRLARTLAQRNSDPDVAGEHLVGAFAAWPVLCRVMTELEESHPELAGRGGAEGRRMLDAMDRRDRTGDYA